MKNNLKEILLGLFFAVAMAISAQTVDIIALSPVLVFALIASLAICVLIPKPYISFAFLATVCVFVSMYDINFRVYCFPSAMLVWSAMLCKEEKVSPIFTILAQTGFAVSLFSCIANKNMQINNSNFFAEINKFVLIPIAVIIFILIRNINTNSDKKHNKAVDKKSKKMPNDKSKKFIMTFAYVWSIVFLLDMALRFKTTINVILPWACAMCYVVSLKEPMIMNAFPFLKKIFNSGGNSKKT